ncbi:MAG: hypothetical protein R3Y09_12130 [Clostridia bacterium]
MTKRKGFSMILTTLMIFVVGSSLFFSQIIFISNTKTDVASNSLVSVFNDEATADITALTCVKDLENLTVTVPKTMLTTTIYDYDEFNMQNLQFSSNDSDIKVLGINIICDFSNTENILDFSSNDVIYISNISLEVYVNNTLYSYKISDLYFEITHKYDEMSATLKTDKSNIERTAQW